MTPKSELHFVERDPYTPIAYLYPVERVLHREKSPFQEILVFESPFFGKVLALDGIVQLTERDEFFYHEMLAHVPLHLHPCPRRVCVVGGGDGGTLREVLKHREVEEVVLVEIDPRVVEVSRKFFPALSTGFDDPRTQIVHRDGADYMVGEKGRFEVILVDSTDPVGWAERLFKEEFLRATYEALTEEGILVEQTESLHFHLSFVREIQLRLSEVFPYVYLYTVALATYGGNWWTFSLGSKKSLGSPRPLKVPTRFYSEEVHSQSFLPQELYKHLLQGDLPW